MEVGIIILKLLRISRCASFSTLLHNESRHWSLMADLELQLRVQIFRTGIRAGVSSAKFLIRGVGVQSHKNEACASLTIDIVPSRIHWNPGSMQISWQNSSSTSSPFLIIFYFFYLNNCFIHGYHTCRMCPLHFKYIFQILLLCCMPFLT